MMVSELCENGDLFDYIRNVPAPSKKVVVRSLSTFALLSLYTSLTRSSFQSCDSSQIKLMLDISRGLQYLHLHKPAVIHRDVSLSVSTLLYRHTLTRFFTAVFSSASRPTSSSRPGSSPRSATLVSPGSSTLPGP